MFTRDLISLRTRTRTRETIEDRSDNAFVPDASPTSTEECERYDTRSPTSSDQACRIVFKSNASRDGRPYKSRNLIIDSDADSETEPNIARTSRAGDARQSLHMIDESASTVWPASQHCSSDEGDKDQQIDHVQETQNVEHRHEEVDGLSLVQKIIRHAERQTKCHDQDAVHTLISIKRQAFQRSSIKDGESLSVVQVAGQEIPVLCHLSSNMMTQSNAPIQSQAKLSSSSETSSYSPVQSKALESTAQNMSATLRDEEKGIPKPLPATSDQDQQTSTLRTQEHSMADREATWILEESSEDITLCRRFKKVEVVENSTSRPLWVKAKSAEMVAKLPKYTRVMILDTYQKRQGNSIIEKDSFPISESNNLLQSSS